MQAKELLNLMLRILPQVLPKPNVFPHVRLLE